MAIMMSRRELIKTLSLGGVGLSLGPLLSSFVSKQETINQQKPAYLMAYFLRTDQNLYYAISEDAKNWTALHQRTSVFKPGVDLRDPFIGRGPDGFHMVHTQGWDHPFIYHYFSKDLIHWEGGPIRVVKDEQKRAWAPEWFYEPDEQTFYVFWASIYEGHNAIYYTKTKDWKDINPAKSQVYYDLGIDDIDFTVIKTGPYYYAFHKPGSLEDNLSIEYMRSPTLDPKAKDFTFGKGARQAITNDVIKPVEGPEIIQIAGQQKWYLYADPFYNDFTAWETTDFEKFIRISVNVPQGAKHCSLLSITQKERENLLQRFPI